MKFLYIPALLSALALSLASCNDRDERLYYDEKLNKDSLIVAIQGSYESYLPGITITGNELQECKDCVHFATRLEVRNDLTYTEQKVFLPKDSVMEKAEGQIELINKNVIVLKSSTGIETILEKDPQARNMKVFRFKGNDLPEGQQPLFYGKN